MVLVEILSLILGIPGPLQQFIILCRFIHHNLDAYPQLSSMMQRILSRCSRVQSILAELQQLDHRPWMEPLLNKVLTLELENAKADLGKATQKLMALGTGVQSKGRAGSSPSTSFKVPAGCSRVQEEGNGVQGQGIRSKEVERLISSVERSLSSMVFHAHFALQQDQMRRDLVAMQWAISLMGGVFPHVYSVAHVGGVAPHHAYGMPPRQPFRWPWQVGQARPQPAWTYTPHIPHPAFHIPQESNNHDLGNSHSGERPRNP